MSSGGLRCKLCSASRFLTAEYCRLHYYEVFQLGEPFNRIKERFFVDKIENHLVNAYGIMGVRKDTKLEGTTIRPDLWVYLLNTLLLVEIDEHQHRRYDSFNEAKRLNLITSLSDNVMILRINPDKYKGGPGIWKKRLVIPKMGEREEAVVDINEAEKDRRWLIVKCEIDHLVTMAFDQHLRRKRGRVCFYDTVHVRYLFYD